MKPVTFLFLLLGVLTLLTLPAPVRASGPIDLTVTQCSNDSELRNKVNQLQSDGGGTLTFNCSTATILLAGGELPNITTATTIDGGNKITLSGSNLVSLFVVDSDGTLTLKNIMLEEGRNSIGSGGAILNNGHLTLEHVTVRNSSASDWGGAIYSNGKLDISDSVLSHNRASRGGAIYADEWSRETVIASTKFDDNIAAATEPGGALYSSGSFSINNSEFTKNKAGNGGAIYARRAFLNTAGTITGSKFEANGTNGSYPKANGGALAIENLFVTISQSVLQKNAAGFGGAVYVMENGGVDITESTFAQNRANAGGGLYNKGEAGLHEVTLSDNEAANGGAIYNVGILSVINGTLSGNHALHGSSLQNVDGSATLGNVTVSANLSRNINAAIIHNTFFAQPYLSLINVMIANSTTDANCDFDTAPSVSINNLSSDNSCSFGAGRDSVNLKLGPLTHNGGTTKTHLPQAGSPAIDNGTIVHTPLVDQRGVTRPQGAGFDVGAVEVAPATPTPTPTTTRTVTPAPTATATVVSCTGKPSKPILVKPKNNGKTKKSTAVLDWNDAQCAQKYKVIIKNGTTTGTRFQVKGGLVSSKFTTNPLVQGNSYTWRVIAINSKGKAKSEWWSFTSK